MRVAIRVVLVLAALVLLGVGLLAIFLPRIAESEAVQARLRDAAREAVGREVRWDSLSVGLLPPRLVAQGPQVAGERPSDPPQLEARNVDFKLALLPLLSRTLVIDSLQIEGVTLRLVRTADGVSLPGVPAGAPAPAKPEASEGEPAPAAAVGLALRELRLLDSRIELEDRTVEPAAHWLLEGVEASARGSSLDDPLQLDVSAALGSGGRIRVSGNATLEGRGDLEAQLDGVGLEPLAPYLEAGPIAGRVTGTLRARGDLADPELLRWDLRVADVAFVQDELALRGALASQGELSGGFERGTGSFSADATDAELRYGEGFSKPAGRRATLSGSLVAKPQAGLAIDNLVVRLDAAEATGRLETGPRMRLELRAPSLDVGALAPLLPALAEFKPAGSASIGSLVLRTEPLALDGQVALDRLRLTPEGGQPISLTGAFDAKGTRIESRDLTARVADETIPLVLTVSGLADRPRYRLRGGTEKANLEALLRAFSGEAGSLSGALTSTIDVEGPLDDDRDFFETVGGESRLDIRDGRMRGVSLLRGSLDRLGAVGAAAQLLGSLKGGQTLQRFYEDTFESITGTFRLGGGKARTDDLQLVYRHYTVDLRGAYGLVDDALDFTGKLTIDRELAVALAPQAAGSAPSTGSADAGATPAPVADVPVERRVIPLAHVGGTLESPRVDISRDTAVAFATALTTGARRTKLEQKIDERLGEGAGKEVLGTLEGILGGGKKQSDPK